MALFDENWLKTPATISERGIIMFNNDFLSDVSLVGDQAMKPKNARWRFLCSFKKAAKFPSSLVQVPFV